MSQTDASTTAHPLKRTPLYDLHLKLGARMVPFAGYEMPLQYTAGILKEHLHTRASAGLFDVSHMGQIIVRPRSGVLADAAHALEQLVPADILGLAPARQRYGQFSNAAGGILDDLMISNLADHYLLIVKAARKVADEVHLRTHLAPICEVQRSDRALLAVQGPKAEAVLASLAPACASMRFMDVREMVIAGAACIAHARAIPVKTALKFRFLKRSQPALPKPCCLTPMWRRSDWAPGTPGASKQVCRFTAPTWARRRCPCRPRCVAAVDCCPSSWCLRALAVSSGAAAGRRTARST